MMIETKISGVVIIEPQLFADARGYFFASYDEDVLSLHGLKFQVVTEGRSMSKRGVIRGLHFQLQEPQARLVEVLRGEIFDVAVDLRVGSPTFGQWTYVLLSQENRKQIFLPPGIAHGFAVLRDDTVVSIKVSARYSPEFARAVAWNDRDLNIEWPISEPIVSERDNHNYTLVQLQDAGALPRFSSGGASIFAPAASCFISYANVDYTLADKLRRDLQGHRVTCFLAPDDMNAGDRIRETIDRAIQSHQKVVLLLSEAAIESSWVEAEVEKALDREREERATIIVPLTLDSAVFKAEKAWVSHIKRTRHVADFTRWRNKSSYREALTKLVEALTGSPETYTE